MVAFITVALSFASFSKCTAIREKEVSRLPADSPASTIFTSIGGKLSGCALMESARVLPFSSPESTSLMDFFSVLFSVCSSIICSASFIGTPACRILTNCLQNTLKSLDFTFFPIERSISLFRIPCSLTETGIIPAFFRESRAFSRVSASRLPLFSFPFRSTAIYE